MHVNESTEELGIKYEADGEFIVFSSGLSEFAFNREAAQAHLKHFVEWLGDTAKLPKMEGSICSWCLRVKEMWQRKESLNDKQNEEFMRHLREDHKIREYAPET